MSRLSSASSVMKHTQTIRQFHVVVVFAIVLALSGFSLGCSEGAGNANNVSANSPTSASPVSGAPVSANTGAGTISASPNPVPAGQGNGRTRITWKTTGDVTPVQVYVAQDAQPEVKFAEGAEGTAEAPWIVAGSNYEFRLYTGSGAARKLINKVQVTRTP